MKPKVSLIISAYNARDDLQQCLSSLESQTCKDFEVIMVNDASTDTTHQFLDIYHRRTSLDLTIIHNKANLGVAGARNVGIRYAAGKIIAFTDADCIVDPLWISEVLKGYEHDGVVAVGGRILDADTANIWELTNKGHNFVANKEGYVTYIQGCNMSFLADTLKRHMFNDELKYGYEEKLLCDYLVEENCRIYYNPRAVVYHKHRNTLKGIVKQKYLRGFSSVWYRKKRRKFVMLKRHFLFLLALCLLPFSYMHPMLLIVLLSLFSLFIVSIFRDELLFKTKTLKEIIITFPFLVFVELAHFSGAFVGFLKFRLLKTVN